MKRATGPMPGPGLRPAGPPGQLERALATAANLIGAGKYRAAIREVSRHADALKHPTGQNILGNAHLRAGDAEAALTAFDAALALAPQFPEAHCSRGAALQELGRLEEALAAFDRAITLRAAYPLAHFNRGNALKALGRTDQAVIAYDRAARLEPGFADVHLNRGFALLELGRPGLALKSFDLALRLRSDWVEANLGRATALERLYRPAAALAAAEAVLASDADNGDALVVRGNALVALKRDDEALEAYERSLAVLPDTPAGLVSRSGVLAALDRYDEALAAAGDAVDQGAGADAHFARAVALRGLGRLEEQLDALDTAIEAGKTGAAIHRARGMALAELGRLDEAGDAFGKAIELDPEDARTQFDHSHLLLYRGDFERGWPAHEYRLKLPNFAFGDRATPRWEGEDIAGKRLLVHAEQGLGDAIQMVRYLGRVRDTGATIVLAIPKPLHRLAAANFPDVEIRAMDTDRADFDCQVSLMSLPHIFKTRLDTIPAAVPYLTAEPDLVAKWRDRVGSNGFRIGVCWSGNPAYRADRYRSIPLAAFAPLLVNPEVRLISLQAMHGLDQLEDLPEGMAVESFGDEISDNPDGLAEIAGLMMSLDLVVSADSAVAHLAGALGQPTWTAIRFQPEWRWLEGRNEPPWYPTMWLFRQPAIGDWAGVFTEMGSYLEKLWKETTGGS
ncbi:MAG: tetratricopeptide repeat protein [Bauldia sp.]|nr:tetratricopeptide repeat protein [Bauldia sp.]